MEVPLLSTWTPNYTKLLISIKKENQANFPWGKMQKKEAWSTVAEAFNATDGVVHKTKKHILVHLNLNLSYLKLVFNTFK